ncbi:hypothetical protein ACTHPF_02835 [Paenibacillus sp. SAF-054]
MAWANHAAFGYGQEGAPRRHGVEWAKDRMETVPGSFGQQKRFYILTLGMG